MPDVFLFTFCDIELKSFNFLYLHIAESFLCESEKLRLPSTEHYEIHRKQLKMAKRNLRNILLISYRRKNFSRRLQILKLAKHARFLQDLAQIRTTEVDRARGNWQRCAMNAAFTGLRKRDGEAAVQNAENAKQ